MVPLNKRSIGNDVVIYGFKIPREDLKVAKEIAWARKISLGELMRDLVTNEIARVEAFIKAARIKASSRTIHPADLDRIEEAMTEIAGQVRPATNDPNTDDER